MNEKEEVNKAKILKLEDSLMDLIETSSDYDDIPVIFFDIEIIKILDKIEYLEKFFEN